MHQQPDYLARMSRSSHDVVAIMELGAQVTAERTSSAAAILVRQSGRVRLGALHDGDAERRDVVAAALEAVALDGPESPFSAALESGQNAILGIDGLAFGGARPEWARELDRLGIAALGITPLIAGDRALGVLVTARLTTDDRMNTEELADQAQVATHLTTFLDTATALTQMRQSSLVVDAMPDAIIGFSRDREVILWNAGAERMYSIPRARGARRRARRPDHHGVRAHQPGQRRAGHRPDQQGQLDGQGPPAHAARPCPARGRVDRLDRRGRATAWGGVDQPGRLQPGRG